jgi:hypothetical protein
LLGSLFNTEDGGDMFLRNVGAVSELYAVTTQMTVFFTVAGAGPARITDIDRFL